MCSTKCQLKQRCVPTGLAIFAFIIAKGAAADGISPSTVQSAPLRQPLMVWCTWRMELAVNTQRTYTVHGTLKESVRNFTRAEYEWDSGSANVLG